MGILDGHTILRFTHAYDTAGGVEQYLNSLNRVMLKRNRMTIIQLNLPDHTSELLPEIEKIGQGTLKQIPMTPEIARQVPNSASENQMIMGNLLFLAKELTRDLIYYNRMLNPLLRFMSPPVPYRSYNREPGDVMKISREIFEHNKISLVVLHLAGGRGGYEIIRESRKRDIPCVILNHFSNKWLKRRGIREQSRSVQGVGGVSGIDVPGYIRNKFANLSDGIDVDLFSRDSSIRINKKQESTALLVSRLVPEKGHMDLLKAMRKLHDEGCKVNAVFAGRKDDGVFLSRIEQAIETLRLKGKVVITGKLSQIELKNQYLESDVVVLPSYSEGLGRVLIEAQAMQLPVIAYNTGGVSEALRNNVTGFLVGKGDLDSLAARLKQLLTEPDLCRRFGDNGRAFVQDNFSLRRLSEKHEKWYLSNIYTGDDPRTS